MSSGSISRREYENLVREGVNAAKAGHRSMARRLLFRAVGQNPMDSYVWLWLSSTTDNPDERRDMLEKAVAVDPNNVAAQTGLAFLNEGRLPDDLAASQVNHKFAGVPAGEPVQADTVTFDCPNCGGRMAFNPGTGRLTCEFCGYSHSPRDDIVAESAETPIVGLLHRPEAHEWAASVHEIACENCGAHTLEDEPGRTQVCPYCGSNQLVKSKQLEDLLDPQAIGVFSISAEEAAKTARNWLNTGLFAPDGLAQQARRLKLRPAYYPFWTFDGGVEIRWSAQVRENYGRSSYAQPEWRTVEGITNEFFDDVLVSGVSALKDREISTVEPFNLKDVIGFEPGQVAGWPVLAYDRSLAAASLVARERVVRKLAPRLRAAIEPGKDKRDVRIGASSWSGVTYKHVLLPLWIGTYMYGGEAFHILVNGQTGKVGGQKPHDQLKVIGIWLLILLSVAVLTLLLTWVINRLDLF